MASPPDGFKGAGASAGRQLTGVLTRNFSDIVATDPDIRQLAVAEASELTHCLVIQEPLACLAEKDGE
jgi:hypothetical protein